MARARRFAPAVVSAVALGGVAWWFSRQHLGSLPPLRDSIGVLVGALAIYVVTTLLRGERWFRLVGRGTRLDAYALTTVGYMGNNALPARAGDILKALLTARCTGIAKRDAFGDLVAERALDALALVAIFCVVVLAGDLPLGLSPLTVALIAAGLAVVGVVAYVAAPRVRGLVAALLAPTRALLSARGAALFGLSVVIWLTEGAVYAILGKVAGIHLGLSDGLYVMALANVAAMIPAAPGYVGTFDAAVLLGVRLAGAGSASVALPYVLVVRFVLFVPITIAGLVLLLTRYGGVRAIRGVRAETA